MAARIRSHRQRRGDRWLLVEEPIELASALAEHASENSCVLVDCMTLWLSNLLLSEQSGLFDRERAALLGVLPNLPGHVILVMNTVGMGVVPMGALSRQFVDQSGLLEQGLAELSERVTLTVAGLPMVLKQP